MQCVSWRQMSWWVTSVILTARSFGALWRGLGRHGERRYRNPVARATFAD
jgi:hypothetical protein